MTTHLEKQPVPISPGLGAKERLCKSAVKLFSQKGYSAASIREIIEDAGVTRPVLYYYFKNKEDLFTFLVESQFEELCAELEQILASDRTCEERLKAVIRGAFKRCEQSPEIVRLLTHFFFSPPITGLNINKEQLGVRRFDLLAAIVATGMKSGEIRASEPERLALIFSGIMDMHVLAMVDNDEKPLTDNLADDLVGLFLHGVSQTGTTDSGEGLLP